MFKDFSFSAISAGLVAVLVGFSSSAVIIFQATEAAGTNAEQAASWLWALGLGMGITSIGLSLQHRLPLVTAWSTPGAAVLAVSLPGFTLGDAIGAFMVTGLLIWLAGATGQFERLTERLSPAIANAMLAGVLLPFGLDAFKALEHQPWIAGSMLATYILIRLVIPRYTILTVAAIGLGVTAALGELDGANWQWAWGHPVWQAPTWSVSALLSLALPLFLVTMASQNLPGIATLVAAGYRSPTSSMLKWTGSTTFFLAPFGAFALNLAAITAAICMTEDAHPDKTKRYTAAISAGLFYTLLGLMAATVVAFFHAVPSEYLAALAGLALLPTIGASLSTALVDTREREAALVTFLVTAGNLTLFGLGGAFWGLLLGYAVKGGRAWMERRQQSTPSPT
ncbi:benzoate transporter [Saccharospirillum salsuginis]|uniref:Benzoate transporter n=1 Tax=Saccharospirillum salsuginis TaxID=418750 RepID=A0A918KS31_9GAMM|nr:benzoate transporter [Saccharospirillum salsuginis]